jgi:hypothetical protein
MYDILTKLGAVVVAIFCTFNGRLTVEIVDKIFVALNDVRL